MKTMAANEVVAEPHVAGPREGEIVVVTSEVVLRDVLAGTLSTEQARKSGLLWTTFKAGV